MTTPSDDNPYSSPRTIETPAPPPGTSATTGSLLVLFLVVFIDLLGFGIVLPLLPNYAKEFKADSSGFVIGLLMSSFSAMQFLFAPWWGRLSDSIGRRPVLIIGLVGSILFYGLFGYATIEKSLIMLFIARIGAGICGATIPTAQAYIADCTTQAGRSRGMAIIGAAFGLGFTFGPLLGDFTLRDENAPPGPGPGYAAAVLSAVAVILAWFLLPESLKKSDRAEKRDWSMFSSWGEAFTIATMPQLMLTLFICVVGFASFESTMSILLKGKLNDKSVDTGFSFSYHEVFLAFAYIGFTLLIAQGFIVRRIAHKIPERILAAIGAGLQLLGYVGMCIAIQTSSFPILFASLTTVTIGFSFVTPSLFGLISRRTDPTRQGRVLGVSQSIAALARIVGPMIGIVLISKNLSYPYYLAIVLLGVGLIMLLTLKNVPERAADATAEENLLVH